MRVKIEIEMEHGDELAETLLRGILWKAISRIETVEIEETEKTHRETGPETDRILEDIIAGKVLGHRRGRTPRAQVRLIQYLYARGGVAPYREVLRRFKDALWRAMRKGYVYAGADNGEKYVALSDEIREKMKEVAEAVV